MRKREGRERGDEEDSLKDDVVVARGTNPAVQASLLRGVTTT